MILARFVPRWYKHGSSGLLGAVRFLANLLVTALPQISSAQPYNYQARHPGGGGGGGVPGGIKNITQILLTLLIFLNVISRSGDHPGGGV
jgi:hypothetical protein